jgi:hypothetical protein
MSSGAAQLPRQRGARVVTAEPSSVAERHRHCNPSEVWAAQPAPPSSWRRGCPDAGHAVRRSLRRADVRPPGRADVQCPGDRCPRDRCPRDRCDPGVRTDRRPDRQASGVRGLCVRAVRTALDPGHRCRGTGHVWRIGFDVSLWSPSGLVVAARIRPGWDGWSNVGSAWLGTNVDGRPGPPLRSRTGCGAALAAWPNKEAGPAPGCRSVGWGARQGAGAHKSHPCASWAGCRRDARPWGWTGRW